jgi:catechol 2,3-dioxygenase-like lactoylglutathione lyase family enzyme
MTIFTAIDHPSIACYDVTKQAEWYCRTFGMRVIASNGKEPPAVLIGYDDATTGAAMIELMPATEPGPRPETVTRFQPGIRHIALRVSDSDAALQTLRELNVRFITEPGEALGGGRTILFRDPEGNELQIVQR